MDGLGNLLLRLLMRWAREGPETAVEKGEEGKRSWDGDVPSSIQQACVTSTETESCVWSLWSSMFLLSGTRSYKGLEQKSGVIRCCWLYYNSSENSQDRSQKANERLSQHSKCWSTARTTVWVLRRESCLGLEKAELMEFNSRWVTMSKSNFYTEQTEEFDLQKPEIVLNHLGLWVGKVTENTEE